MLFTAITKYANFSDRSDRKEFWGFFLLTLIIGLVTLIDTTGTALNIISVALLIPTIALYVRRSRDLGKSPWLVLLMLVPLANLIYFLYLGFGASKDASDKLEAATA
jgi:uncharacterized membrane protein YhaH (DUF805 family)